jgi:Apea-like HEPN
LPKVTIALALGSDNLIRMGKKNTSTHIEDARFILQEVDRFLRMTPEQLMAHFKDHKRDAFASIPHSKRGVCFCGIAASDRFWAIANRFLDADSDKGARVDRSRFVEGLKAAFSACFLDPPTKLTESLVNKMLTDACKASEGRFVVLTHYIPCAIFLTASVKRFSVGPVEFVNETEFWNSNGTEIQALRGTLAARYMKQGSTRLAGVPATTREKAVEMADSRVDQITAFFKQFNWIAVVKVDKCDESVSYDYAIYLTRRALDVIKLFLGEYYTQRLRTAEDHGHARRSAKLARDSNNQFHWSLASTPNDNVVGDNWLLALTQNEQFELASKALTFVANRSNAPLCTRFIDALAWYGDAVSERQSGAKIVKFVTAIERIAGTGKDDPRGVTQIIKSRAGLLYHIYSGEPLNVAIKTVSRVYGLRSVLVHGSCSPFDPSLKNQLPEVASVTRLVVVAALDFFVSLGIECPGIDNDALRAAYRALEAQYPLLASANSLDHLFTQFVEVLNTSVKQINEIYFSVSVAGRADSIYRERAFCYELYHQLRLNIPQDSRFAYWLTGEPDKNGHPLIESRVAPDLVLHEPGNMNQNFCVLEIKPINGKLAGFKKDFRTLSAFTTKYGYHAGILLIYGDRPSASRRIKQLSGYFAQLRASRVTVLLAKSPSKRIEQLN